MVGSQEWPMSQGSLNSSNRPSIRSPNGPLWFSNNPTKKFGKFDPMSASSLHMSWLWWGLDGMRLRLIEKLCTNFSLAPASMQGSCTEQNTIAHRYIEHRTQHQSTDAPNIERMVHIPHMHRAQHQSTHAPNTMVHTSHMEVHNTKVQMHQTRWCTHHIWKCIKLVVDRWRWSNSTA